jgi:hypothetical protein
MAIDTIGANSLLSAKRRRSNASILYEVPHQAGDEEYQKYNHEKWQASNPRRVHGVRDKDV